MLHRLLFILVVGFSLLVGCGSADASEDKDKQKDNDKISEQQEAENILYEKDGLVVSQVMGWSVGTEKVDPLNVTFNHQHVQAIVSLIETEKTFDQLKEELLDGAGNVELVEEKGDSFSYQSKQKESIRTNVYFRKYEDQTMILSFLSKVDSGEGARKAIDDFKSAINYQ